MKTTGKLRKIAIYLFMISCYLFLTKTTPANNLAISNVTYTSPNITFTITWDNAWYSTGGGTTNNWDAVWVFIKNQTCQYPSSATTLTPAWTAVTMSTTTAGNHVVNSTNLPIQIDAVSDGMGVFIHLSSAQLSNSVSASITLKLTGTNLTPATPPVTASNFRVFGIEMAYIPQASYSIGDGSGTTVNPFTNQTISSEALITFGSLGGGATVDLPAGYPKGYNAFYCMKQEISQSQYKDFLNTLSYDQQVSRTTQIPNLSTPSPWALTAPSGGPYNRNGIKVVTAGVDNYLPAVYACDFNNNNTMNQITDGQHITCNYLIWADVAAYLDWAGLRPMTELEYEKVCRGTLASVSDEYPWGTTNVTSATSAALVAGSSGMVDEASSVRPAAGLCVYNNGIATDGPIRGGASTTSSSTREQAAAAYYGPLDMAGNVWEQVVSVSATTFTGTLGNGLLSSSGNATNADWPGTNGVGSGMRGGGWDTTDPILLRTSDRTNATTPATTTRTSATAIGGRGVR